MPLFFFHNVSKEKKKKSPYNGLVSAIYFTSIHSDSVLSCVVPLKTTITSQLNPFCIYSCICLLYASITQHGNHWYKEKLTLLSACLKQGQNRR